MMVMLSLCNELEMVDKQCFLWRRKLLSGPVLCITWAMLAQSKIKLGQYC